MLAEIQQELSQTQVLLTAATAALGDATSYTASLQTTVAVQAMYTVALSLTQGQPQGVLQYLITKIESTLSTNFTWSVCCSVGFCVTV